MAHIEFDYALGIHGETGKILQEKLKYVHKFMHIDLKFCLTFLRGSVKQQRQGTSQNGNHKQRVKMHIQIWL